MGFEILAVRSIGDAAIGDGMYPVPDEGAVKIVPEPLDGHSPQQIQATALSSKLGLEARAHRLVAVRKVKADVVITDQRLAISCEKYNKGRGWVELGGGDGSHAKILVGHVRYQWLHSVAFRSKGGLIKLEHVRLEIADASSDPPRPVALHLELPSHVSSAAVAREIVGRATKFWLAQGGVPAEHLDTLRGLSSSEPLPVESDSGKLLVYRFPFSLPARPQTALLAGPSEL